MKLFELDLDRTQAAQLVVIANQLQVMLDENPNLKFTVDKLLSYLYDYDIIVDVIDLYTMIKQPPLDGIIDNIQGKDVIFVGQNKPKEKIQTPEPTDKTVKQMASRALKKH